MDQSSCQRHGRLCPQAISAVTPRPIAFISSMDANGVGNVSPYSYFNVMSHDPMMITIGWWLSQTLQAHALAPAARCVLLASKPRLAADTC